MIDELQGLKIGKDEDAVRRLLTDPDSEGVAVYLLALSVLGSDALHGEDAELVLVYKELEEKFSVNMPLALEVKLQAIVTLIGTDAFFDTQHGLHGISNALTQGDLDIGANFSIEKASWEEMQWAAFCAAFLRDDEEEADFEPRVLKDMILALHESGEDGQFQIGLEAFMAERKAQLLQDLVSLGIPGDLILLHFNDAEKGKQTSS